MNINDYQKEALTTAIYPADFKILYPTLGLVGEAGEVAEKVKKVLRDNGGSFTDEKKAELAKEIGDVLWYCANLANDLGYTLDTIAQINISKLQSRKERDVIKGNGDNR